LTALSEPLVWAAEHSTNKLVAERQF